MGSGIYFPIAALGFAMLTILTFYIKKPIKSVETDIYRWLVLTNFLGLLLELACTLAAYINNSLPLVSDLILKSYLVYNLVWTLILTIYVLYISVDLKKLNEFKNKIKVLIAGIISVSLYFIYSLDCNLVIKDNFRVRYTEGLSVEYTYVVCGIFIVLIIGLMLVNRKELKSKRYIPIYMFLIAIILGIVIQKNNPGLLIMTYVETLTVAIMYHTIENPDMKLLEELHKAKEISDNANEEKTLFLYNMTQEIRHTASKINEEADIIINSEDIEVDKDSARNIKGETAKFRSTVNDIMDVSAMDTSSIKIYNSKYNVVNLLKEIVSMYNGICLNKELSFRINIEHDIPELLYGDSIGLKKSIMNVLTFSINNNNTKKGYLEFSVNTVRKKDILRLIITIEDNGVGIGSNELEKIKINDKYLSLAYKLVTLMNGTMIIASDYGMGNKIKIVIDQRVVDNISKEERQYNEVYQDKKILVVDDNEASCKIIEKLLKGSNITVDKVNTGKDCLNKIREKNKYDLILLDEELKQITGMELLAKLKEIRNFNIPVILLSKDNSYEYNEEYLKSGFCSVIIKPIKKEVLLEKIDKFTLM